MSLGKVPTATKYELNGRVFASSLLLLPFLSDRQEGTFPFRGGLEGLASSSEGQLTARQGNVLILLHSKSNYM